MARLTIALDVQENGRGPHTDASVRFAADGTLTKLLYATAPLYESVGVRP